jgi:uncharacterized protein YjbI with pentapeptide repeats
MERYALVIGIGQYDGMQPLSKPAGDAIAVADCLKQAGWRVTRLGDRVTGAVLEDALREFLEQQAVGQDALIYFTGHGFMVEESEDDQRGYLASSDCGVEYDGKKIVGQRRGLSFGRLNGLIGRARLSSLVVLLDCCHGGLFVEDGLVKGSFRAGPEQNFCWIAACRSFQQAYAYGSKAHSLFTGALLEGLNSGGEVTVLAMVRHLNQAFRQESMQEPIYIGAGKDIPLIVPVPQAVAPIANPVNPYQGLRSFTKETRQFFFGRDREIQVLVQKVQDCGFVPVIGASGSGKSSVVRAGLMPRLEEMGWRVLEPIVPGTDPMAAVRSVIAEFTVSPPSPQSWGNQADQVKTLLVVDQFEEVFTLCRDRSEQAKFIQALMNLKIRVVVTMRADFVEACLADVGLTKAIEQDAVYLGPMVEADLEAAIERPAIVQGVGIQPKLLAQILQDVQAEENCLPLLEFALYELWEQCSRNRPLAPNSGGTEPGLEFKAPSIGGLGASELTLEVYRKLGGVTGALNDHAEGIYKQLAKQKQEDLAKQVLLKLVRTGKGTKDTRQRQRKADLLAIGDGATIESAITALVDGRLLVSDRIDGQDVIDLSHEALTVSWKRFVGWRESDRETLELVQRVEDASQLWRDKRETSGYLMQAGLLTEIDRAFYGKQLSNHFSPPEQVFIKKSYRKIKNAQFLRKITFFVIASLTTFSLFLMKDKILLQWLTYKKNNLTNAKLSSIYIPDIDLEKGNLADADLSRADLSRSNLNRANLSSTKLVKAYMPNSSLHEAVLTESDLSEANLERANLSRANLSSTKLVKAYMPNSSLHEAVLTESDLSEADLERANLSRANLKHTIFLKTHMPRTDLTGADISGADFRGNGSITPEQIKVAKNWDQAIYDKEFCKILNLKTCKTEPSIKH